MSTTKSTSKKKRQQNQLVERFRDFKNKFKYIENENSIDFDIFPVPYIFLF